MNWEATGALAEMLGALAVIGTLAYLGLQIRQQNLSHQLAMKESILEGFNRVNEHLATDSSLATLFVRGLHDPDQLNDAESAQFSWLLRLYVNQYIKLFNFYKSGTLSDDEWLNYGAQGAWMMSRPGGQRWLAGHGGTFQEAWEEILKVPYDESVIDFTMGKKWDSY